MQSFLLLSLINSALPTPKQPGTQPLFTRLSPSYASRWPSFLVSAALHLLLVLLVPYLSEQLTSPSDRELWKRQERLLRTLRIRIPEQLYIASAGPSAVPNRRTVAYRPVSAARSAQGGGSEGGPRARRGRAPGRQRRFDLPPLQRRADSDQSIVQPRYSAETLPQRDLHLPEVFFWAPPLAPQAVAQSFVLPGHAAPPTQSRVLDAPPRLELPYPGPAALALIGLPQELERLALVVPSDTMPIRITYPEQPSPRTGVSADPLPGDPTTVLSVSSDPLPLREFLTVPPGNQVGRSPASGSAARGWEGGAGHSDRGTGANGPSDAQRASSTDVSGSGGAAAGAGGGPNLPGASGAGAGLGHSRSGPPGVSDRTEAGTIPPAGGALSASTLARSPAVLATQVTHPTTGVFDVVVQSSGFEGFPESAGVLSGKPIYSVYLAVGAPKDWILQYCIPASEAEGPEVIGSVVRLGTPPALTAPYPKTTFRPPVHHRPGGYLMVHGFIGANGRFHDIRVLGTGDAQEHAGAIAILEQWEFRPATRQGQPVRVEMLLAIPAE